MGSTEQIHIGGRELGDVRHICAFFHNKDEEYETLMDFTSEGLARNDRAFHIVDSRTRADHRKRLIEHGLPVEAAEKSGQLKVACWEEAYLKDGCFDQERQIRLLSGILEEGKMQGYRITRLIANMEWALEDKAGVTDIVEYESRLNYVLPNYDDPVVCTYDLSRFNAGIAMDILRTHPLVILGGVLQENPLYVSPDEFLAELKERKNKSGLAQ